MKKKISDIKKTYIVCAKCGTETILPLGSSLTRCSVCFEDFRIPSDNNIFIRIGDMVEAASKNRAAEIGFICDDD